ncbi:MAG: histidine phosphatase family protein [Chloroflexi bacterium]|nr:histidine phosphatase family protein [Chloroflexota bacterium]
MTEIILARHGETEWNVGEIFRGRIDIDLSATGIKQAELLGKYLRGLRIAAIYSSPQKRAVKTAQIVATHHNIEVKVTPGLSDLDFGQWQGLSLQEVKVKFEKLYTEWVNAPHQVRIPDGESLDAVRRRAIAVVDEVVAKYKGTVVLVSHRVVNKVLICALLGLDNSHFWNIKQDTCGITTFIYENGQFVLAEHNNTSFLKTLQKSPLSDF